MSLRLLQINLHHSKAASAELLLRLTEGEADLVLVQEPWVEGGKVAGLGTKEHKLMLDPKEGQIRTRILAKRHLSIFLLRNYSNGDNTAVSLELQSGSIRDLSAYLAFEKENPRDALVRGLAEECEKLRKGLVIGCDANAHHTQWCRFYSKFEGAVKNWAYSNEHSSSDHRFIESILSLDSPLPISFANPRQADWHRYKEVMANILPMERSESITNPQELDQTVYKFTEAYNTAFKLACPTEKSTRRKKPPGGPKNYQSSEPNAVACLTEQRREMRTLIG